MIAQDIRVQVNAGEFLRDKIKQVGVLQLRQPAVECEVFKYLPRIGRKLCDVIFKIGRVLVLPTVASVKADVL